MSIVVLCGSIAFITSMIGLFPQIYKALKTKATTDISMLMLINYFVCSVAWIIYGYQTESGFVQSSNILGLISCIILIIIKCVYDKKIDAVMTHG